MPAPYPLELRERVVDAYLAGAGTFAEVGELFSVGEATVNRWVQRKRRTGGVAPSRAGGGHRKRKIDEAGLGWRRARLEELPDTTMVELARAYEEVFGVQVSNQRVGEAVRLRLGMTRKRGPSALRNAIGKT